MDSIEEYDKWFQEHQNIYNNFSKIERTNVFISNEKGSHEKNKIRQLGIDGIISLGSVHDLYPTIKGINYLRIVIDDDPISPLFKYFKITNEFINLHDSVLIHCQEGISRSVTICMSHLIQTLQINFENAYKLVKKCRNISNPNKGFIMQLKNLENNHIK